MSSPSNRVTACGATQANTYTSRHPVREERKKKKKKKKKTRIFFLKRVGELNGPGRYKLEWKKILPSGRSMHGYIPHFCRLSVSITHVLVDLML